MIRIENTIASELYDIIDHCRDDTLENFKQDLLSMLNAAATDEVAG